MHAPSWPSVGHETLLTFGCVFHRGLAWRIHIIAGGARWWSNRFSWNVMTDHAIRLCQPVLCGNLMRCGVCNGRVNCWYCDTDSTDGEARFLLLLKTALKFPSLACSQSIEGEEGGGGGRKKTETGGGRGGGSYVVCSRFSPLSPCSHIWPIASLRGRSEVIFTIYYSLRWRSQKCNTC